MAKVDTGIRAGLGRALRVAIMERRADPLAWWLILALGVVTATFIGWVGSDRTNPAPTLKVLSVFTLGGTHNAGLDAVLDRHRHDTETVSSDPSGTQRSAPLVIRVWEDAEHPWPEASRDRVKKAGWWQGRATAAQLDQHRPADPPDTVLAFVSWRATGTTPGEPGWLIQLHGSDADIITANQRVHSVLFDQPGRDAYWDRVHPMPKALMAPEVIRTAVRPDQEAARQHRLLRYLLGMILAWLLLSGGSLYGNGLGLSWMRQRHQGDLEPYALIPGPLWPVYLADLLRSASEWAVLAGIVTFVPVLFWPDGSLGPWLAFLGPVAALSLGTLFFSGTLSLLSVMFFHHPWGRQASWLLLWPLWAILAMSGRGAMLIATNWSNVLLGAPAAWPSTHMLWGALALQLAMVPCVIVLIERRIGRRRVGLRELA